MLVCRPMLDRFFATYSAALRQWSLKAGSVDTDGMRKNSNKRSILWSRSRSIRSSTASSEVIRLLPNHSNRFLILLRKLAIAYSAEKLHRRRAGAKNRAVFVAQQ